MRLITAAFGAASKYQKAKAHGKFFVNHSEDELTEIESKT